MHKKFLKILKCPNTNKNLLLDIIKEKNNLVEEGYLFTDDNKNRYIIKNGIPRFINSNNYSKSFGWQWKKWAKVQFEENNIGKPMQNHTSNMFSSITEIDYNKLNNDYILEIGCGSGRFLDLLKEKNCTIIGIDNSESIDVTNYNLQEVDRSRLLLVQCDTYKLPFKDSSFHHIYTIGVLHHTPNPKKIIENIFKILKTKGSFSLTVYNKNSYYSLPNVNMWRKFFNLLNPIFGFYPALIYSYFTVSILRPIARLNKIFDLIIRTPFPFCNENDYNWSLLDTFDSITPKYQNTYETYEVYNWLKKNKFINIVPTNWGSCSFKGEKD